MVDARPFLQRIEAKRLAVAEADKNAAQADRAAEAAHRIADVERAELRAWEEAFALVRSSIDTVARAPRRAATLNGSSTLSPAPSGMKASWKAIMQALAGEPTFDLDRIVEVSAKVGYPMQRATARSQMSNYAKSGLIDRVREGTFKVTAAGAKAAGSELDIAGADEAPVTENPPGDGAHPGGLFGGGAANAPTCT